MAIIIQQTHSHPCYNNKNMQYPVRPTYILTILTLLVCLGLGAYKPAYLFDPDRAALIFEQNNPAVMLFLGNKDQSSSLFHLYSQLSNENQDVLFVYSRKGLDHYLKILQFVGVQDKQAPIMIYRNKGAQKYYYDPNIFGEMNHENMADFIESARQNIISPFLKSRDSTEDLEDQQLEEYKKYLTYYNSYQLRDTLKSLQKQLVLVIYGKWCFYSEKLSPTFTQVAKRLRNNGNLLFGKIDGNWNQIQNFEPVEYPTITFWRKNMKQPIVFAENRTAQNIINWIKQNTQFSWVEPLPEQKKIQRIQEAQVLDVPKGEQEQEEYYEDEYQDEYFYQDEYQEDL